MRLNKHIFRTVCFGAGVWAAVWTTSPDSVQASSRFDGFAGAEPEVVKYPARFTAYSQCDFKIPVRLLPSGTVPGAHQADSLSISPAADGNWVFRMEKKSGTLKLPRTVSGQVTLHGPEVLFQPVPPPSLLFTRMGKENRGSAPQDSLQFNIRAIPDPKFAALFPEDVRYETAWYTLRWCTWNSPRFPLNGKNLCDGIDMDIRNVQLPAGDGSGFHIQLQMPERVDKQGKRYDSHLDYRDCYFTFYRKR